LACLTVGSLSFVASAAEPDLPKQTLSTLRTHCYRCHGQDGTNEGGFNFVLDRRLLVNRGKVVPGDPAKSKLFKRLASEDDPMPPEEVKTRPNKDEIAVIRKWIEAGAADFGTVTPARKLLTPTDVTALIRADLESIAQRDRRHTRYFTLTHLYNAGLSPDEMQSYRHGLSKLVNSLSWGPRIVVPKPIDPAGTIFRIDLRDYQWNEATWDAILAANPYGVSLGTDAAKYCAESTGNKLAHVRADWFVAAGARPPLYHDVLKLPDTDRELEKLLRVDVAENIRQERVARSGFNGSGVSRNNRLIERHESGAVVYWKSYDFIGNVGRQNLFAHPLGPGDAERDFQQDGGEIIFNLPNGLQAYLLVDGKGRRIDKGPTSVVSDPKRPDRAVENGLSCMSCHAKGMIEKNDQIREHVLKNPKAFADAEVDTIKTLFPKQDEFNALIRKDARRFQEAVAKTGAPLSVTEPIVALALRFEAEMDLPLVAAEAGVAAEQLLQTLDRSAALAKHLGALKVRGGTIQRSVFVDSFADLMLELRIGEFLPSRQAKLDRLIQSADDLLQKGELERAIERYGEAITLDPRSALAYNNRGLALKRKGELELAIADFSAAVRLDPRFAVAYHNRGSAHQAKGELDKAISNFNESLRIDPGSAVAFNNRGYALFEKGNVDKALADFDEALRLQPKFAFALNNRGLAHSKHGEQDKAIADFTAAIVLDRKFAKAYWNRGVAYEKKGDARRAADDRKKAIQLDPSLNDE
jgi:tetratricopeptide (TPR) repeat protein/mono/diheme cytochrome c family protein